MQCSEVGTLGAEDSHAPHPSPRLSPIPPLSDVQAIGEADGRRAHGPMEDTPHNPPPQFDPGGRPALTTPDSHSYADDSALSGSPSEMRQGRSLRGFERYGQQSSSSENYCNSDGSHALIDSLMDSLNEMWLGRRSTLQL
jgi:hypothetical protein